MGPEVFFTALSSFVPILYICKTLVPVHMCGDRVPTILINEELVSILHTRVDRWMDGWMDEWMDGWNLFLP